MTRFLIMALILCAPQMAFAQPVPAPTTGQTRITPTGGKTPQSLGDLAALSLNVKAGAGATAGAVGNGTTDDSAAIAAVCAASQARGDRYIWFPAGTYNVATLTPQACGNSIFVGSGTLVNAYRKWVFDPTLVQHAGPTQTLNARLHLPRLSASRTPTIDIVGDSTCGQIVAGGGAGAQSEYLYENLVAKILRDFGSTPVIINNRCWPGTTWGQIASTGVQPTTNIPSWAINTSASWQSYVLADNADAIIFDFGMNDGANPDPQSSLYNMSQFLATLKSQQKPPDVAFNINYQPSLIFGTWANQAGQEGREAIAGWQRTFAQANGYGYIDLGQAFDIARDGFDPIDQAMMLLPSGTGSFASGTSGTFTWPQQTQDFAGTFTSMGDQATFWGAGTTVSFTPRGTNGSNVVISNSGGFLAVTVTTSGSLVSNPTVVSTIPVTAVYNGTSNVYLSISMKRTSAGAKLVIQYQLLTIFDQNIIVPGGLYTPVWRYAGATVAQARTVVAPSISTPRLYLPVLTDYEMYGNNAANDPWGGGGVNHAATRGIAELMRALWPQNFFYTAPATSENRVINGDFAVDQIHEGGNTATPSTNLNIVDRWRTALNGGTTIVFYTRSTTAPPGFGSSIQVTLNTNYSPTTAAFTGAVTAIEGPNIADLNWGTANASPVVLSFWVKASVAGTYPLNLTNSASSRVLVMPYTVSAAGVWQYISVPLPGDITGTWLTAAGTVGLKIGLYFAVGTTYQTATANAWQGGFYAGTTTMTQFTAGTPGATMNFTGVRLIKGSYDRPAMPRSYADTLSLARRYYQKTFASGTAPAQNVGLAGAFCTRNPIAAGEPAGYLQASPPMAGVPTVTTFNPSAANANWRDVTAAADAAVTVDPATAVGPGGVLLATAGTVATLGDTLCIHATLDAGY